MAQQHETAISGQNGTNPDQLPPEQLTPHPKNSEVYDTSVSDRFVDRIREGVRQSLKVTRDSEFAEGVVVISGHRRRRAAIEAGLDAVPVEWLTFDSAEEEIEVLHEYNDYRDLKFSERMALGDDLWNLHEAGHQNLGASKKEIRETLGDRTGIGSHESYRKAQTVWDAANDGDEQAQVLVDEIDAGEQSIHGAYTKFKADPDADDLALNDDKGGGDDERQKFGDERVIDNTTDDSDYYVSLQKVVDWYNDEYDADLATDEDGILRSAAMIAAGRVR